MHEFDDETTPAGSTPAAPDSRLASLRARRDKAMKAAHTDLPVWWDENLYVRYRPVTQPEITSSAKRYEKSKDPAKDVLMNAAVLAKACLGVFEEVDGELVSIDPGDRHGDAPRFDARLAELLEVDTDQAVDVVRAFYGDEAGDGRIISTAAKVAEFSGYTMDGLEERAGF